MQNEKYNKEDTYFKDALFEVFKQISKEQNTTVKDMCNTLKYFGKFNFKDR